MNTVINTNMAAIRTHGVYNRNNTAMNAAMTKVATGLKINSAQDNASGYAITERMRERIRALDQANQNTQNDTAMMKTAEGALSNTVSILTTLRERAIDSANDSNNDSDRAKIQTEVNELLKQVDENAKVKYNNMYLLNGSRIDTYASKSAYLNSFSTGTPSVAISTSTALKDLDSSFNNGDLIRVTYSKGGGTPINVDTTDSGGTTTIGDIFSTITDFTVADITAGTTITTDKQGENVSALSNGITLIAANSGTANAITGITIQTGSNAANLSTNGNFGTFTSVNEASDTQSGNALNFRIGEELDLTVSLADMRTSALGISNLKVSTKDDAKTAVGLIDTALEMALKEQTKIGAYEQRLGYASDNLTTARENVEASASTIADSDIAKEMTNYMRYAVLSQASQYMLSQASQNAFSVLNLLQV